MVEGEWAGGTGNLEVRLIICDKELTQDMGRKDGIKKAVLFADKKHETDICL